MARSIGSVDFDLMFGTVADLKTEVDLYKVFGQRGVGVQAGGASDGVFSLRTVFYADDASDADSHIGSCEDMQGTIITVADSFGTSFSDCLVVKMDVLSQQRRIYNGSPTVVRVEILWQFERTA